MIPIRYYIDCYDKLDGSFVGRESCNSLEELMQKMQLFLLFYEIEIFDEYNRGLK